MGIRKLMGVPSGRFDGHAHVFLASLPMIKQRRYTPGYDASITHYVELLKSALLDGALLIQPSFLGTDNSYLLDAVSLGNSLPSLCFRGVAVVDSGISIQSLGQMHDAGIVGIRFNLIGHPPQSLMLSEWQRVFEFVAANNWHVEIQCEGDTLASVLPFFLDNCPRVVVDHFGLPDPEAPLECPGFATLCDAPRDQLLIKISAPYRVFKKCDSPTAAAKCKVLLQRLVELRGSENVIWGSDWPWTQFEGRHNYADTLGWVCKTADG